MENITIKHRHHYVFQAYLKSWATNNQVWCCRNKKSVFVTNTTNVAQERDFYRIKDINTDELKFLSLVWHKQPHEAEEILKKQLAIHQKPLQWKKAVEGLKLIIGGSIYSRKPMPKEIVEQFDYAEKFTESAINDMIEDIYSEEEGRLSEYIELLKGGDLRFYTQPYDTKCEVFDNTRRDFIYLLVLQHFRTKAMRERWIKGGETIIQSGICEKLGINSQNLRLEHLSYHVFWFVEALVADILYEKNAHLTLLINDTGVSFVTTDQPIINLLANYQDVTDEVSDIVYYYPISPNLAITINDSNTEDRLNLSKSQVEEYNRKLIDASYEFVFADNEKMLRDICVGDKEQ